MKNTSKVTALSLTRQKKSLPAARSPFPLVQADEKYLVWGATENGRLLQVVFVIHPTFDIRYSRPGPDRQRKSGSDGGTSEKSKRGKACGKDDVDKLAEATAAYGREIAINAFDP